MPKIINEFEVPKCEGVTFSIRRGQILRVIEIEGVQAADIVAYNAYNTKESYSAWLTRFFAGLSFVRAQKLYSQLPNGNVMFTNLTDREGVMYLHPGTCTRFTYEQLGFEGYHKNCQDILAGCIKEYGMTPYDVRDVINLFMSAVFHEDGSRELKASPVKQGDYADLLAEMDLICAISACPDDMQSYNDFQPKPLGVKILE